MRRWTIAVVLLATSVFSGCSGADEPVGRQDPDPSTSPGQPTTASTAASPDAAPAGPFDPCTLLTEDERGPIPTGFTLDQTNGIAPTMAECALTNDDTGGAPFAYGYDVRPSGAYDALLTWAEQDGEEIVDLDVADRAFHLEGVAYAEAGGRVVYLRGAALPSEADLIAQLDAMAQRITAVPADGLSPLPKSCPAATDAAIARIIGKVHYAHGRDVPGNFSCTYATKTGVGLKLAADKRPAGSVRSGERATAVVPGAEVGQTSTGDTTVWLDTGSLIAFLRPENVVISASVTSYPEPLVADRSIARLRPYATKFIERQVRRLKK